MLNTQAEQIILRHGEGGYREYRIPGMVALPDGSLLLSCEARKEDSGDWGDIDILVMRIKEGGRPEQVLRIGRSSEAADGTMRTYHNPVLILDGGQVHLIYHLNYERAFHMVGVQGGRKWLPPEEITDAYRGFPYEWNVCATGPGHGLRMQNGRLIAPVWLARGKAMADGRRREHWPSVAGMIYSDDHGKTWKAGAMAPGMLNGNETSAAQLPDGRVLFNFRNMNADRRRVLGLSEDGGTLSRIWTAEGLVDPMCFGGMASGRDGVFFVNCVSEDRRENLSVHYTNDGGNTWETLWRVDRQGGYADIACGKRALWVFYERQSYEKNLVEELVLRRASV